MFTDTEIDLVAWYGFISVLTMMVAYALEDRQPAYTLAFCAACLMAASYAVMINSWPFAVVETIWALVAARKWGVRKGYIGANGGRQSI